MLLLIVTKNNRGLSGEQSSLCASGLYQVGEGLPVVPDVYNIYNGSLASTITHG